MRCYFTEEDQLTRVRGSEIRAALVHAHHQVRRGKPGEPPPPDTDVWFHGLGVHGAPPLGDDVVQALLAARAECVLFQLCDHPTMSFERIPEALAARARLFLRNHWPADLERVPEPFRARLGFLPPMLKPMAPSAGRELAARTGGAIFFGTRTGFANMADGLNAREQAVRLLRGSGLPFVGGISPHAEARYATSPELLVPRMTEAEHTRLLADSKVCVAPWGNHPLTYRFFEGMALRCLVVAQPVREERFLDGGLVAGRHYVEVAADLGDLVEVVRYYLSHPSQAQRIADAGHAHFRQFLASRGPLISSYSFDATVASWGELYRPAAEQGLASKARAAAARWFPTRF
jgi:glycosyltransferase involved in cell wall biosynthesis